MLILLFRLDKMLFCENCEYKKRCERFKLTLGIPGKIGKNIVAVTNLLIAKCVVQFFSPYCTSASFRRMFQIERTDRAYFRAIRA